MLLHFSTFLCSISFLIFLLISDRLQKPIYTTLVPTINIRMLWLFYLVVGVVALTPFSIPGVNIDAIPPTLDLLDHRIEECRRRMGNYYNTPSTLPFNHSHPHVSAMNAPDVNLANFTKFELTRRKSLTAAKLAYVLAKNPNSVIVFLDTHTVLVPDQKHIEMPPGQVSTDLEAGNMFRFQEFNLNHHYEVPFHDTLLPASSCYKFGNNNVSGSTTFSYCVGAEVGVIGEGDVLVPITGFNFSVALAFSFNVKLANSQGFTGSHTCSTTNGLTVRLFYTPALYEILGLVRNVTFHSGAMKVKQSRWDSVKPTTYISNQVPIFYCATEDKMQLSCHSPTMTYTNERGHYITSKINNKFTI